ncbi:MAG: FHA domain-containing protein [Planctomycetota bacterium]
MGDERLRDLERRAAGGDVEAGVAWIQKRLRLGTLDEERLAVAAYLGDPAAAAVRPEAAGPDDDVAWCAGSSAMPREFVVRVALTLVRDLGPPPARTGGLELWAGHGALAPAPRLLNPGDSLVIGRSGAADVQVAVQRVSAVHCRLVVDAQGEVEVEDLGSRNGTYLERERVTGRVRVRPQERVYLGGPRLTSGITSFRVLPRLVVDESPHAQACAEAAQAWLEAPSAQAAGAARQAVLRLYGALDAAPHWRLSPAALAARAAAVACFAHPPALALPPPAASRARALAREHLAADALGPEEPLPLLPPPPLALSGIPRGGRPWFHAADWVERNTELRALRGLGTRTFEALDLTGAREVLRALRLGNAARAPAHERLERTLRLQPRHPFVAEPRGFLLASSSVCLREAWVAGRPFLAWAREHSPPRQATLIADAAELLEPWTAPEFSVLLLRPDSLRINRGSPRLVGLWAGQAESELARAELLRDVPQETPQALVHAPPEVVRAGARPPEAGLVYGLASLLYLGWVGEPAFPLGEQVRAWVAAVLEDPPTPPRERGVEVSPALEACVLEALHKDPSARPSLAAFAARLREG